MAALRDFAVSLTYPLTLTLVLLAIAAVLGWLKWRRSARALAIIGLGWSVIWSLPVASESLRAQLEDRYPMVRESSELPRADAIVVLGGGMHYSWMKQAEVDPDDLQSSRLAAGARAWLAGRAPVVILSGGGQGRITEAKRMANAIERLGVPHSAVVLEERSHDTDDNARFSVALAPGDPPHILLVTSALHMPRATLLFERAGARVVPVPVPEGRSRTTGPRRWLPSPRALWRSGRALKEYLALTVAHARG